ncbi:FAD-dependent oxidoreductase [Pseudomonas sp. Leaf58]|uniref:FAD-dependent oxidoreductase n=1 Tax=Pseudomonas sp. Leaf58 TaxID=1736226 RepID=UPI0006F4564F|nr:FAD-dependent oxidoreductase [Pseudomonas sp. Leaf58]KQN61300.1 fumarate reductase [Pseudomonas sp. Leaf58]
MSTTTPLPPHWDQEVDLLVFGAGTAGMTSALMASHHGLDVLLCEKTAVVGGISATSGGTTWVPGTTQSQRAGVPDSAAEAATFLKAVVGERGGDALRAAFLASGPQAIDELERISEVKFVAAAAHPDYVSGPGAAFGGRALAPLAFDGRLLGKDFARVRPPRREFMGLGGMMVPRADLDALLAPFASVHNLTRTLSVVGRYCIDRLSYPRGTHLVMGNALVARLFYSLRQRNVAVRFETPLHELILENGQVVGAVVLHNGQPERIRARRGVVLATGGLTRHPTLRKQLFPAAAQALSLAPLTHTGDGIDRALKANAQLDNGHDSPGLWMPCSIRTAKDGYQAVWPHILLDRAKPGLIAVNARGQRFVNESDSYHDFVMGMLRDASPTAHLICDQAFLQRYGLGLVMPLRSALNIASFVKSGYLIKGRTLGELASKLKVDAEGLANTISTYNAAAAQGDDPAFKRGSSPMNRHNGDPQQMPNPCVRPLGDGPYYAVTVQPADLACSAGLRGNADGQVLNPQGQVIEGLYACGNDLTSVFRGTYPGPGTTLGPAIVFGWRVARHAAGVAEGKTGMAEPIKVAAREALG